VGGAVISTLGVHDALRLPARPSTHGLQSSTRRLRGEGTAARRAWRASYVRRIVLADALCALIGGAAGLFVRMDGAPRISWHSYASFWLALALPAVWVVAMLVSRSYEERFLWIGPEEFRRVFGAAVLLLAAIGTLSWGLRIELSRVFVVVALPLAMVLTLLQRYAQRRLLHRRRARGHFQQSTLLVGHRTAVLDLHEQMEREASHGYRVIGCCLPGGPPGVPPDLLCGIPVLGDLSAVAEVVARHEVDTVAVLPCPELDGPTLRRLGWDLEKTPAELLLAPAITEIVGTRVQIRPVCGLPLLHMDRPELAGVRRLAKGLVDRVGAVLLLLLLAPMMILLELVVRSTSRGPALYQQQRIGRDGHQFSMRKYRSMFDSAARGNLRYVAENEGNGVLFKLQKDPRVTPVGKVLRRYSLDELPQLFNVLRGDMSLVGPRPPLPLEAERYGFDMHRRFLVKPGMTGLWQVSGRSDLSWEDSVRLDVRYVENWSLAFDFMILCKTVGVVLRGSGAY
jgi:exopolysaccharide biosynthesis polyprenyl glycosylphosphotransferase